MTLRRRRRRRTLALITLWLTATACSSGTDSDGALGEALGTLPADAGDVMIVFFAVGSLLDLGADPPVDGSYAEKAEYVAGLSTAGTPLDTSLLTPSLKEQWGFDLFDVEWQLDTGDTVVLGFRDDFTFDRLESRFRECGFEVAEREGATVYSRSLDLNDPCLADEFGLGPPPQIVHTALLEDENMALLGGNAETLDAMLAAATGEAPSLADTEAYAALASQVSGSQAAVLAPSEITCRVPGVVSGAEAEELERYQGREYAALAFGMTYGEERGGRIVMHYEDSDDAEADLDIRESALREGLSPVTRVPYREMFLVEEARVEGSDVVIDVEPVGEGNFLDLLNQGDTGFALC